MSVFLNAPARPFSARQWDGLLRVMLETAGQPEAEVDLFLERDGRLAELNRDFMACPGPTNVLSFPAASAGADGLLGEICIGYDTLLREAVLYGQSPQEQGVFLLAHGLAHVLGHDHGPDMDIICARLSAGALESEIYE